MATNYIPPRDADFALWSANFAALITATPTAYGLIPADATAINAANTPWQTAYATATNPSTRTTPAVAAKDAARATCEFVLRPYAQRINADAAVTDDQRADLGLTIRKTVPTPIPAPSTMPVLSLISATHLAATFAFRDSTTPTSKAKPYGVVALQVVQSIGTTAATDPSQCEFLAQFGKSPFPVAYDGADVGKVVTMFGRWVTQSGPAGIPQVGPWSTRLVTSVL